MIHIEGLAGLAVGCILLFSSVSKLIEFSWFVEVLAAYRLTPPKWARGVASLIVASEMAVGAGLVSRFFAPWPAYAATVLLAALSVAVLVNLVRGRLDLACGCSGLWKGTTIGWQILLRNSGFMALALLSIGRSPRPFSWAHETLAISAVALVIASVLLRKRAASHNEELEARQG